MGNILLKRKLAKFKVKECPKAADMFKGQLILCKVVKVYDGDTITIVFRHPDGRFYQEQCRLMGLDAPEMHPAKTTPDGHARSQQDMDAERKAALEVRDFLAGHIDDQFVNILFDTRDKYGRLLGTVYTDSFLHRENINKLLLKHGNGVKPYDGKTKALFRKEDVSHQ